MFLGTHTPKLDDKGRLFLPARFRPELAQGVVVTKGQERCLYVFTDAAFTADAARRHSESDTASKATRDYNRIFFASAFDTQPDGQGRITLPTSLRTYAGLSKECVVIGANTRLEIWDAARWAAYETEQEQLFSEQDDGVPAA